ncbi:NAD(P)H-binding protein [Microvirga tunisiensis]|uniref:NAD(P)H-binding protein n=1 Tax=Pannonibacter tanglangensis TaxID=2750084 RepID=A0A7X5F4B2_9HYPH|nr:SDR family oxidoreductase [Pannonibacter sp. XCT-53]NBN78505.1 NAD(P)H-binding protein [Pannonibacter sp. XCT-53]
MIAITGASGELGRLVVTSLLSSEPAASLRLLVRDPAKVADLVALGAEAVVFDYNRPETLAPALAGVDRLLFISSSEVGSRAAQHTAVIDAAKAAGVSLLVYTSILRAPQSGMLLAAEHAVTEAHLARSGLAHVILRNGWYLENFMGSVPAAIEHGAVFGASGAGRISAAARADYAAAAAAVLRQGAASGTILELAGDTSFTKADLAAEIARQSGKPVAYTDMSEAAFKDLLVQVGLPEGFAHALADADTATARGDLFDDGKALSRLIGRPTVTLAEAVAATLKR